MFNELWHSPEQLSLALRWLTFSGICVTAGFGAAIYFINDRISALQNDLLSTQARKIESQTAVVQEQSATLSSQTNEIARLTAELAVTAAKAASLETKALNAERGVSDNYDFNGARRQTVSGRTSVGVGAETTSFQKLFSAYQSQKWSELRALSEEQIIAVPRWLTPYLFSGIANANLGDTKQAEERLSFVVSHAGSDPDYTDARRLLEELKRLKQ